MSINLKILTTQKSKNTILTKRIVFFHCLNRISSEFNGGSSYKSSRNFI